MLKDARYYNALGNELFAQKRLAEAAAAWRAAVELEPVYVPALNNLSLVLLQLGDVAGGAEAARAVLRLDPENTKAMNRLGAALNEQQCFNESVEILTQAVRLRPDYLAAHMNLAVAYSGLGEAQQAIDVYRHILRADPDNATAHSGLLFTLNYLPQLTPGEVYREHVRFDEQHARPLLPGEVRHANDRNPDRPLRVGYVSRDFRDHAMSFFIEPILANHDPRQAIVFCYGDVDRPDDVTRRLSASIPPGQWRLVAEMSDEQLAELVRQDQIDILIDLAVHTRNNRLLVFARKPAPVQATYLGYPQTTGLHAMDYKISTAAIDPPGTSEQFHSERIVRLPESYFCYVERAGTPPVGEGPPADAPFTFVSVNGILKLNDGVLATWAKLLQRVPEARLLIASGGPDARARLAERCQAAGLPADRVEFRLNTGFVEFMTLFNRAHVALDTFPFNGGTTTCHTLWMGVPVITLRGQTPVGRMGADILGALGLTELVAEDADQYIALAAALAADRVRVAGLRRTLRQRMLASPLLDAEVFTRNLEAAYRRMWLNWVNSLEGKQ